MEVTKIEEGEPGKKRFELSGKMKKTIDYAVNGFFMVMGVVVLFGYLQPQEVQQVFGILVFYIGVRFYPR